jgi:hypothetical protein
LGVGLKEEDVKIFMDERWSEFVKVHDLKTWYIMVFKKLYARSLKMTILITIPMSRWSGV